MASGKAKVTASAGLNVRTEAGTSYSKLGALAHGTTVSYSNEKSGWLQIQYNNRTGYICKAYTQITQAATSGGNATSGGSTSGNTSTAHTTPMTVTASTLNVRKGPGTSFAVAGTVSKGTQVNALGTESNGWVKISYKGSTAYVSGKYVKASGSQTDSKPPTNTGTDNSSAKTTTVVVNSTLNIRSAANTSSSIVGTLKNGDTVTYTSDQNNWLRITSPATGYICKTYTKLNPNAGSSGGGTISPGTIGAGGLTYLSTKSVAARDTGCKTKTIVDLKTKKQFNVSWDSSPGYHSDCTPMTKSDTDVFKNIRNPSVSVDNKSYWGNKDNWSWDARPAAIKLKDGTWVACGYHQRPHAAIMGGNPGHPFTNQSNTRPSTGWALGGHFCLYYGDSPGGTPKCNTAAQTAKDMSL